MATRKPCPGCGTVPPVGAEECPVCALEAVLEAERAEREAKRAATRMALGTAPLTRSTNLARIGLDGAAEALGEALRFAPESAPLRAAAEAVGRARSALARVGIMTTTPRP